MAFIPVPGAAQGAIALNIDGQICQMSFDVQMATESPASCLAAAEALGQSFIDNVLPQLSASAYFYSSVVFGLTSETSPIGVWYPAEGAQGGFGTACVPNNVAFCVKKETGLRGRSARGRVYLCGLPSEKVVGINYLDAAWATAVLLGLNTMRTEMVTAGFPLVVVSRYTNNAPRVTGVHNVVQLFVAFDYAVDSQRRRLPGRGQ